MKSFWISVFTGGLMLSAPAALDWYGVEQGFDNRMPVVVSNSLAGPHTVPVRLSAQALRALATNFNPRAVRLVDPTGGADMSLPLAVLPAANHDAQLLALATMPGGAERELWLYWSSRQAAPARFPARTFAAHGAEPENWRRWPGIENEQLTLLALAGCNNLWPKAAPELALSRVVSSKDERAKLPERLLFPAGSVFGLGGFQLLCAGRPVTLSLLESWSEPGPTISRIHLVWSARPAPMGYAPTSPARLAPPDAPPLPPLQDRRTKQVLPEPWRVVQDLDICAGDAFVTQQFSVQPPDATTNWELRVGMNGLTGAVPVAANGWLAQWRADKKPKSGESAAGSGLALASLDGAALSPFQAPDAGGWILKGPGAKSARFLLMAGRAGGAGSASEFAADLRGVEKVQAARAGTACRFGAVESRALPEPPALAELSGWLINSTSETSAAPVRIMLELYGYSLPAGSGVSVKLGSETISADVFRDESGRHEIWFPAALPPMSRSPVTLQATAPAGAAEAFSLERGAAELTVSVRDERAWTFDAAGLRKIRGPAGVVNIAPPAEPAMIAAPAVVFTGRYVCVVRAGGAMFRLPAQSAFWEMTGAGAGSVTGNLWVAKWSSDWGAYPAACPEWKGQADLFGVQDWAVLGTPAQQLWLAPTPASPRIVVSKNWIMTPTNPVGPVTWMAAPPQGDDLAVWGPYRREEYFGRNAYHAGRAKCMWLDPQIYAPGSDQPSVLCALTTTPDEGRKLAVRRFPPKFLTARTNGVYVYRDDANGDGCPDTWQVQDVNGDGPDLLHDRWLIDADSDGSIQSIFAFRPAPNGRRPGQVEVFLDGGNYHYDGVVDLQSAEARVAQFILSDQTQDGIFLAGDLFYGGINQRDAFRERFGQDPDDAGDLADVPAEETKIMATGRALNAHHAVDLDGDGNWDAYWFGTLPNANNPVLNYGHIGAAQGVVFNPLSGHYYCQAPDAYPSPAALMRWCSRVYRDTNGVWRQPHWFDNPQSDLNLDDDPAPEVHVMSQTAVLGSNEFHYLSNRMVYDLNNDNGGRPGTTFAPGNRGRSFDLHLAPKTFYTSDQGILRAPVWPARVAEFRDAFGNGLDSVSQYLAVGWDGKYNPVYDAAGHARDWLFAWDWSLTSRWDSVAAVWSPSGDVNPEAMQIFEPQERPGLRYDQQVGGITDWHLYRSPLTGFPHLQGAQWGWRSGARADAAHVDLWRETCYWALGFDFAQWIHDVEFARATTKAFEAYFDRAGAGMFDTALLDRDNDGVWDRRVWNNASNGVVLLAEPQGVAVIPARESVATESLRLENYRRLVTLYTNALAQRMKCWLDRSLTPTPASTNIVPATTAPRAK